MLFNTLTYAKFFAIVFVVSWLLRPDRRARLWFLLGSSYVFYAHWDWRFLPLLFGSSSVDFWLGRAIGRSRSVRRRKLLLGLTLALNLGVLATFKYLGFGVDAARAALEALGFQPPRFALEVALPVGISFFTFESLSYVIDVYRREIEPHSSYLEYLNFVAFFPHLVAGPIIRPRDLLPQLGRHARFMNECGSRGLFLIGSGLLKKVAIGDYLALNLVDRVFDAPVQFSSIECYAAVVGYAIQIYCDFSGYTDVAMGSALLLGVRFPKNFDSPYQAVNVRDFWRRWHISLSSWLRDYLYVPLGGSRHGAARTYFNLMLTMLLGGLWHGASWNFVIWGGLHGAALALTRAYQRSRLGERARTRPSSRSARIASGILTFHGVCLAWVFFRAETLGQARLVLGQLMHGSTHHPNLPVEVLGVLGIGLLSHFLPGRWLEGLQARLVRSPVMVQGAVLCSVAWILRRMSGTDSVPFVYFQF